MSKLRTSKPFRNQKRMKSNYIVKKITLVALGPNFVINNVSPKSKWIATSDVHISRFNLPVYITTVFFYNIVAYYKINATKQYCSKLPNHLKWHLTSPTQVNIQYKNVTLYFKWTISNKYKKYGQIECASLATKYY